MLSTFLRSVLLLTLFLLVTSCSSTRVAYGFLDWAISWHIGKYVDLNSEQKKISKAAIDKFHSWHRKNHLPLYADYVSGLKTRLLSGNITGEQIHAETDQLQIYLDACIEQLLPTFVDLAADLSDQQVEGLKKNLKNEREKYKKKYMDVSDKKKYKLREKELAKHLERVLNKLTDKQEKGLQTWARSLIPYEKLTYEQQIDWAEQAEEALRYRDNRQELEKRIRGLMFYHSENWGEEAERILDTNQALTYNYIASVFNSMDGKQRAYLEKTLDGYVRDFQALSSAE